MSGRKRQRQSEGAQAKKERTFKCITVPDKDKEQKSKKRRKTTGGDDGLEPKIAQQLSPFTPSGKFKTHDTMDQYYKVEPYKEWSEMTRYNSFVLNGTKYFTEGFVYLANDESLDGPKQPANSNEGDNTRPPMSKDWIARVLEIRASNEHNVFARVYWMYSPDELPEGVRDGNNYKPIRGRQPYHGSRELIASNHMDIVCVTSVTRQAIVNHWVEDNDSDVQENLYWRQALDVRKWELSSIMTICTCDRPANPDEVLVGCEQKECGKWMHQPCIKHAALMRTYEALGKDKPHRSGTAKDDAAEVQRPLSPTGSATAGLAQDTIGVVSSDGAKNATPQPADKNGVSGTPVPGSAARKGRSNKKAAAKDEVEKPYQGLFEVEIRLEPGIPALLFKDLRKGVDGDKEWEEPLNCLVCGHRCT